MYDIALPVSACLGARTEVQVAWPVAVPGQRADPSEAIGITPGGGRFGAALGGALDDAVADLAATHHDARLATIPVGPLERLLGALDAEGDATFLLMSATDLPEAAWQRLVDREPLCLVTTLDETSVVRTAVLEIDDLAALPADLAQLVRAEASATLVYDDRVITVLHPTPTLVLAARGPIAEALADLTAALGWKVRPAPEPATAVGLIRGLTPLDMVVVMAHDVEQAGPVLQAALESEAGYIGALGSPAMQQARAEWLAARNVTDLSRVFGPAGLDIGARRPPEVATAVLAEALAVRSGRSGGHLRAATSANP